MRVRVYVRLHARVLYSPQSYLTGQQRPGSMTGAQPSSGSAQVVVTQRTSPSRQKQDSQGLLALSTRAPALYLRPSTTHSAEGRPRREMPPAVPTEGQPLMQCKVRVVAAVIGGTGAA